jgi:uncharacterized RDD family membrane protein YckC
LASLLDVVVAAVAIAGIGALGFKLFGRRKAARRLSGSWIVRTVRQWANRQRETGRTQRPSWRLRAVFFIGGVLTRNWRGPGARMLGLRRVDARTGGPVTLRSAIVREIVTTAWNVIGNWLFAPVRARADARRHAIAPEIEQLRRTHGDDQEALNIAMARLYEEHKLNPFAGCIWALPRMAFSLAQELPAIWSPRNQGLADRLAGTEVVVGR